ncbi:MAG: DUF2948 family protein [Pseudomonadota bacterium]
MTDARFQDGADAPLHLIAQDAEDLGVLSALVQDAVFVAADLTYRARQRRFAILLTRFRWEDRAAAEAARRPYERVRSLLVIEDVGAVRSTGLDRDDKAQTLSLLSLTHAAGADGTGVLTLALSGGGTIALEVEALEARLEDVTRPHGAASARAPRHD